jgi:hypothetical protein
LGVTPTAEDVVIGAAYRALMRHYHPDTNSDPNAQARAQEIAAAYAMLRDPEKRADYDAQRASGDDWWPVVEPTGEQSPPMRRAGIATTLLAAGLVGAVWLWPQPELPLSKTETVAPARQVHEEGAAAPAKAPPRPAAIAALADPPIAPPVSPPEVDASADSAPQPAGLVAPPSMTAKIAPPTPARRAQLRVARQPKSVVASAAKDERVATLDRMSTGFFSQSMANASDDKKKLLLAARDRSEAQRKACRSDSCVADSLVRQIRETGAIMEKPAEVEK